MTNIKRLLRALYNITRLIITGWYELWLHLIDSLERYENTCKKREKRPKTSEKVTNGTDIKPPCL